MLAEGYFWRAERGFGYETRAPAQRRRGKTGGNGGGGGDGDVVGGDYHVVQLLCAPLSLAPTLSSLSLFRVLLVSSAHQKAP